MTLKIPWHNIYKAPVEATCTDIYLLLSPCQTAPYNAEEEELHDYLVKMKAVEEIEENQRAQFAEASTSSRALISKL